MQYLFKLTYRRKDNSLAQGVIRQAQSRNEILWKEDFRYNIESW